jgi:hypothetical protein
MKFIYSIILFLGCIIELSSQRVYYLSAHINSANDQTIQLWKIYPDTLKRPEDEYLTAEGEFKVRWPFQQNNDKEWEINFGDKTGSIRQRWNNKPYEWEMRLSGSYLFFSPKWPNQIDATDDWIIQFNDKNYSFRLRYDSGFCYGNLSDQDKSLVKVYNSRFKEFLDYDCEATEAIEDELILVSLFLSMFYSIR